MHKVNELLMAVPEHLITEVWVQDAIVALRETLGLLAKLDGIQQDVNDLADAAADVEFVEAEDVWSYITRMRKVLDNPDMNALHEDRARVLEEAAESISNAYKHSHHMYDVLIRKALVHRAKISVGNDG